jgi:hypothetical protein
MRLVTFSFLFVASTLACGAAAAVDLVVNSSADSGDETFRTALDKANTANEAVTITFSDNISTINLVNPLPPVSNPDHAITIDGGGDVRMDGDSVAIPTVGLDVRSDNVTIQGMIITKFIHAGIYISGGATNTRIFGCLIGTDGNIVGANGDGIAVGNSTNVVIGGDSPAERNVISGNLVNGISLLPDAGPTTVQGNYIGTTPDGLLPLGNGVGIKITGGSGHTFGGDQPGEGNVISGNYSLIGAALWLSLGGDESRVLGNIIGMDATGTAALPNAANGIVVDNVDNIQIGGTTAAARNVISGNTGAGVLLFGSENSIVQVNYIGVDSSGAGVFGNARGIFLEGVENLQIGGTIAGAGNVISNNLTHGIFQSQGISLIIQGNTIGMDASRTIPSGNGASGIHLFNATGTIGGLTAAAGNVIAYNTGAGVEVSNTAPVAVRRNTIFGNTGPGIFVLGGSNLAPTELTSAAPISGTAQASSTIELFVDAADEGRICIGSVVATAGGAFSSPTKLSAYRGKNLTAVVTSGFGFTSGFSNPLEITNINNAHTADIDGNLQIELSELLRIVQLYNAGSIGCAIPIGSTEDGYSTDGVNQDCVAHPSDYAPQNWSLSLSEVLRAVQMFNLGAYSPCPAPDQTEDGFCIP